MLQKKQNNAAQFAQKLMKIQSSKTKSEEELNVWENSLRDKGANGSSSRMKFGSKKSSLGMYPTGKTTVAAIKKQHHSS